MNLTEVGPPSGAAHICPTGGCVAQPLSSAPSGGLKITIAVDDDDGQHEAGTEKTAASATSGLGTRR